MSWKLSWRRKKAADVDERGLWRTCWWSSQSISWRRLGGEYGEVTSHSRTLRTVQNAARTTDVRSGVSWFVKNEMISKNEHEHKAPHFLCHRMGHWRNFNTAPPPRYVPFLSSKISVRRVFKSLWVFIYYFLKRLCISVVLKMQKHIYKVFKELIIISH